LNADQSIELAFLISERLKKEKLQRHDNFAANG
jgi:hypothetical protein